MNDAQATSWATGSAGPIQGHEEPRRRVRLGGSEGGMQRAAGHAGWRAVRQMILRGSPGRGNCTTCAALSLSSVQTLPLVPSLSNVLIISEQQKRQERKLSWKSRMWPKRLDLQTGTQ